MKDSSKMDFHKAMGDIGLNSWSILEILKRDFPMDNVLRKQPKVCSWVGLMTKVR
jgi:hypothetical protein